MDEADIKTIESVLTVVGGRVVYGAAEFTEYGPPPIPVLPEWSPVSRVPGHWRPAAPLQRQVHHCAGACTVHGHAHQKARTANVPTNDFRAFWGAFGCSCFAF